ncbi:MAG: hypothetical protein ACRELT_14910 [Longimicrobiales bacterium]
MAKTDVSGRTGGTNLIPVAVAVIAVGLFFGWVATREPPEAVAVVEPDAAPVTNEDAAGPATAIEPDVLNQTASARALIGETVELASVPVSDVLGGQMFWIELPGGSPYLVKLDSATVAGGGALPAPGSSVRVVGRLLEKTPEVLDSWMASGALEDSNQRMLAEFGSTFIEARRVEPAGS